VAGRAVEEDYSQGNYDYPKVTLQKLLEERQKEAGYLDRKKKGSLLASWTKLEKGGVVLHL